MLKASSGGPPGCASGGPPARTPRRTRGCRRWRTRPGRPTGGRSRRRSRGSVLVRPDDLSARAARVFGVSHRRPFVYVRSKSCSQVAPSSLDASQLPVMTSRGLVEDADEPLREVRPMRSRRQVSPSRLIVVDPGDAARVEVVLQEGRLLGVVADDRDPVRRVRVVDAPSLDEEPSCPRATRRSSRPAVVCHRVEGRRHGPPAHEDVEVLEPAAAVVRRHRSVLTAGRDRRAAGVDLGRSVGTHRHHHENATLARTPSIGERTEPGQRLSGLFRPGRPASDGRLDLLPQGHGGQREPGPDQEVVRWLLRRRRCTSMQTTSSRAATAALGVLLEPSGHWP